MYEPRWSDNSYPDFDYQNISYYSAPKRRPQLDSIEEVDPALRQTWERLNIPVEEQKRLANVKPVRLSACKPSALNVLLPGFEALCKMGLVPVASQLQCCVGSNLLVAGCAQYCPMHAVHAARQPLD